MCNRLSSFYRTGVFFIIKVPDSRKQSGVLAHQDCFLLDGLTYMSKEGTDGSAWIANIGGDCGSTKCGAIDFYNIISLYICGVLNKRRRKNLCTRK